MIGSNDTSEADNNMFLSMDTIHPVLIRLCSRTPSLSDLYQCNDLPNSNLQFHLFADDTNVNFLSNDLDYRQNCVNESLKPFA